jgi:hypothetical protein
MEIPYGPNATIRTNNGDQVRRIPIQVAPDAWREQQQLDRELSLGSRFPEGRTGNTDASIVTGAGVDALMGGYDSQVKSHQVVLTRLYQQLIGLCFEVDDKVFPNIEKTLSAAENGTAFEVVYTPNKDIAGDYTVQARFGLMAGLDPNRWLVFALQAKQADMFSRDFMRREMPFDIDVEDEGRKIDIEKLGDASMQALMSYAQAIPQLAASGADASHPLQVIINVMKDRASGKDLVKSMLDNFQPPAPSPEEQNQQDPNAQQQGAPAGQGQLPVAGGKPSLGTLLASLNAGGKPNVGASIKSKF